MTSVTEEMIEAAKRAQKAMDAMLLGINIHNERQTTQRPIAGPVVDELSNASWALKRTLAAIEAALSASPAAQTEKIDLDTVTYATAPQDIRDTAENIVKVYWTDEGLAEGAICAALTTERARRQSPQPTEPVAVKARLTGDWLMSVFDMAAIIGSAPSRKRYDLARHVLNQVQQIAASHSALASPVQQRDEVIEEVAAALIKDGFFTAGMVARSLKSTDEALLSALSPVAQQRDEGWQDIATAPKDGTWFLGWAERPDVEDQYDIWHWDAEAETDAGYGFWINAADSNLDEYPTHWKPLESPPALSPERKDKSNG